MYTTTAALRVKYQRKPQIRVGDIHQTVQSQQANVAKGIKENKRVYDQARILCLGETRDG